MAKASWIWKETAEVLGVLGVIASLIFVALEIRQGTDAVRSSTIQAIADQSFAAAVLSVENADLRSALSAQSNGLTLTEDQDRQIRAFWNAALRIQQNRYLQIQLGILDEETAVGGLGPELMARRLRLTGLPLKIATRSVFKSTSNG